MELINLGCGSRSHPSWTNMDFSSNNADVISHNLLKGIPYTDNYFDVVYHSHLLEHFTKGDATMFLIECLRVLKPNGIIRIAVPDLEKIAKEYLKYLELSLKGDENAKNNYEWIKLEMYDQTVRNESGGEMAKYLFQKYIPNENYVFERIGDEGRNLRRTYLKSQQSENIPPENNASNLRLRVPLLQTFKNWVKNKFFLEEVEYFNGLKKEISIGKFRLAGEIHQWMYDRYSLSKSLAEAGFSNIEVKDAFSSKIKDWSKYELESKDGIIFKPDSLFMEAVK